VASILPPAEPDLADPFRASKDKIVLGLLVSLLQHSKIKYNWYYQLGLNWFIIWLTIGHNRFFYWYKESDSCESFYNPGE